MAGLNILTLGSSKTYTNLVALGISSAVVDDTAKTITFTLAADGSQHTIHFNQPSDGQDGVSVTGVSDKGNGVFTLLLSDGSESDPIQCVKGEDGFSPTATVEKVGKIATITITDKNGTTTATIKDGEGSEGGEANVIDSISVNGVNVSPDENKNVDITVPSTEGLASETWVNEQGFLTEHQDLSNYATKDELPSLDGYAKTSEIPSKVSELENDSNYLSSIPEEYVTETELSAKGYLTEHQDISGKVDKVEGKSLISDTEIARLASVDNYDDTDIKAEIAKKADATSIPSKVSELTNDSNYQTAEQVSSTVTTEIAKVVADAPEDLNTLKEMSDWIAGHENDASAMNSAISDNKTAITALQTGKADKSEIPTTVAELSDSADYAKKTDVNNSISTLQTDKADASDLTAHTDDADIHVTAENKATWNTVSDKVDKEDGKGLSTNDYTNEEKSLVATIEDKVDKTSIVTALDNSVTDEQVASALLAKTELDKKVDKTSIATELSDASTDDEVVGALTAYNELQKLESANKEQFATATGDYITVNDSVDGNIVELGIKGNSFQKTYSGKNLLSKTNISYNATGLTITDNKNGTYSITSGTTTGTEFRLIGDYNNLTKEIHLDTSKTYKVTAKIGSANLSTICVFTDGSTYTNVNSTQSSFTLPDGFEDISSIFIRFDSSASYSGTLEVMLYEYTEGIDETFEPYVGGTPSPNPSYPQAIKSVGDDGSLVVKSCGKNLLNPILGTSTMNGVTCTANGDGTYTLNGTATSQCTFLLCKVLGNNCSGMKIIGCPIGGSGLSYSILIAYSNESNEWVNETYEFGYGRKIEYSPIIDFNILIRKNTVCNNLVFKPMITTDINATYDDFEPYKGSTTTIPLSEPLRSIGDIKDEITYQDGKWGVLRRIKEINLSDLAWSLVNNDTYQYWRYLVNDGKEASSYNTIANIIAEKYMASSWYNTVQLNSATNAIAYGFNANNTSAKIVAVHNGSTTESPTGKFLYELITPTFEPFADQTLPYLSTYDGVTNISNDDALSAEMTVKYPITDASGVGSRNESGIAELDNNKMDKSSIVASLSSSSTDTQVPSAKAVWNKSKNKIQRLLDGTDIIVYADSISNEIVTDTVRIMNATNSPYGVDNVNNDFHYTIYNVNDNKYKRILAYDIRKNDMYMIVKNNNIWGTWAKLATMDNLGGLTFSASGTTLSITDGTHTWTLEANS